MYKNGQRPGAIQNMTIDEFKARKQQTNGKFLIRVLHHKIAASTGPANLIIGKKLEKELGKYLDLIRVNITPKSRELGKRMFLIHTGNTFRKISESIRKVAQEFSVSVPTATIHRKVMATTAHCDDTFTDGQMRALNYHMSHSAATSSNYYQRPAAKKAMDSYSNIQALSKKHFFTGQEDKIIKKEWPLNKGVTPTLELCRRIVNVYKMDRTAKQLQDRWLTLSKKQ